MQFSLQINMTIIFEKKAKKKEEQGVTYFFIIWCTLPLDLPRTFLLLTCMLAHAVDDLQNLSSLLSSDVIVGGASAEGDWRPNIVLVLSR